MCYFVACDAGKSNIYQVNHAVFRDIRCSLRIEWMNKARNRMCWDAKEEWGFLTGKQRWVGARALGCV